MIRTFRNPHAARHARRLAVAGFAGPVRLDDRLDDLLDELIRHHDRNHALRDEPSRVSELVHFFLVFLFRAAKLEHLDDALAAAKAILCVKGRDARLA